MENKKLNIWKDVLEKNFKTKQFPNATSIRNKNDEYTIQLFELLVAETLNLHDQNIKWNVTQHGHDEGVDLIGHELNDMCTPFINESFNLISLGQVKRRTSSYKYEDFKNDLYKINEFCKNSDFFRKNSLRQFLFILSSDHSGSIHNIQTHFQKDTNCMLKTMMISYVGFIDAQEIFMSWKNNYDYFEKIIHNALSSKQLACFKDFVNSIEGNWISISVSTPKECIVNMPIEQTLTLQTDNIDLGIDIFIKWHTYPGNHVQLLNPLSMVDPRKKGHLLHISGKKDIKLLFRSNECGEIDLGEIEIYSYRNQFITKAPLNSVTIKEGFSFYYYRKPNETVYQELENILMQTTDYHFFPIAILGNGGIGKSSLISEIYASAVQREYITFDIAQPKDQQHDRFVINKLFRSIIYAEDEEQFFDYTIVTYIRKFLGLNFDEKWGDVLNNYFTIENSEVNSAYISDCLVSCVIKLATKSRVFLWLSDLQWASSETITILEIFVNELYNNKKLLRNNIVVIFEGRKNEYVFINNRKYYPAHWNDFTNNCLLKKYDIKSWNDKDSYDFFLQLFGIESNDEGLYRKYLNDLLCKSKGNPMHMLESVRYLLEKQKIAFNKERQIVILNNDLSGVYVKNIYEIIKKRIIYYQKNYKNYIDILSINAKLNVIQPILYQRLIDKFCSEYDNLEELENESAFGAWKNNQFYFAHENYLMVFRDLKILNESIIFEAIDFFSQLHDSNSKLSSIILKSNLSNCNLYNLRKEIIKLLKDNNNIHTKIILYHMLLDMPELLNKSEDLTRTKVLFELAELNVKDGNWENGLYYLNELCEILEGCDYNNILYKLKAKQEMSNILADMLMLDKSIQVASEGIELAEAYIEFNDFSPNQIFNLKNECQKLYARLAVCYWFSGNIHKACEFQRISYFDAQRTENTYMSARVLYEIGTLQFHWNLDKGIETILAAKEIGKYCMQLDDEKSLIEVQLLIGRLLKAVKQNDYNAIEHIKKNISVLLDAYRVSPSIYEEFLCYTMQGICYIKIGNYVSAMNSFLSSLKSATESHMTNLEWKALFNIMQLHLINGNESSAAIYAQRTSDILTKAIKENPICKATLEDMLQPVLKRLNNIFSSDNNLKMLSVAYDKYLFVIMN